MTPAFVIDLDGTLVDTAPDLLDALNVILARKGRPAVDLSSLRNMVGFGARALLAMAFKLTGAEADPARLDDIKAEFIAEYGEHIADHSRPYPGVVETLEDLKAQGVRMGILTNKPQELSDLLLSTLGLDKYFAAVLGHGNLPYGKPDARIFADILLKMGGVGLGAVMIGDSITDVQTARAAGVPVVLVSYGYTPDPARVLGADAVVDAFPEVPDAARGLMGAG